MSSKKRGEISHVAVLRLSAMGDVAMTVPVVAALRRDYPRLRISVLTRPFFTPFFRDIPDIEFIDFQPAGRHKGLRGLVRLARDIRHAGVDAVADLHDVLRTKIVRRLLWLSGRRVATIDKGRRDKKLLTRRGRKELTPLTPMIERYRQTLAELGLPVTLELPARVRHAVPAAIEEIAGKKGKDVWVGVAPFAKHKGKIYPIQLASELIGALNEKYGRVFIFGGGDHERSFAEGMESLHRGVVSVIGKVSLSQEMDLMSNLDAMVTMDSASMHIASLLGVPVVSVWGATHPYAGFYGYAQAPENAVQVDMECRPCSVYGNRECVFKDYHCLSGIAPERIATAVDRVVGASVPVNSTSPARKSSAPKTSKAPKSSKV